MSCIKPSQAIKSPLEENVYLLVGNQMAFADAIATQWKNQLKQHHPDLEKISLSIAKQADLEALHQQLASFGLFSQAQWIHITIELSTFKKHNDLLQLLNSVPKDKFIFLQMIKFEARQKKNKWFQAYEKQITVIECFEPTPQERDFWLKRQLKIQKLSLTPQQMSWLIDATHGHLSSAFQEIVKLSLLSENQKIEDDLMRKALSESSIYTSFELIDAIHTGNTPHSLMIAEKLMRSDALPLVAWSLNQEVRLLLALKVAQLQRKPIDTLLKQHRVWASKKQAVLNLASIHPLDRLQSLFQLSSMMDKQFKGAPGCAMTTGLFIVAQLTQQAELPALKQH